MKESLLTLIGIFIFSHFKFIAGPVLATAAGFNVWVTILVTIAGMMSSVLLFSFLGREIKEKIQPLFQKEKKIFSKKNRKIVKIWKRYGEIGIAFFTPLIFTPIGGTLILVSFGTRRSRIFYHMLWSATLWATIFSFSIEQLLEIPFLKTLLG